MLKSGFILCPFSREEYKAKEQHAGTEKWDVFELVFEDDKEVACHVIGVGVPPEIEPIRVDLVAMSVEAFER